MHQVTITKEEFKNYIVSYQGLNISNQPKGKEGVLEYFNKVGTIQFDVLNVVGRNADLVLQSRIKNYRATHLSELLYKDRLLVDGWDKVMSIYQTKDWKRFSRVREKREIAAKWTLDYRNSLEALDHVDKVIDNINERGPLMAKDLDFGNRVKTTWGHGKLSSAALDYLYHKGVLGIHNKKHNQKSYDLIENLIPQEYLSDATHIKSHNEFLKWYIKRRINSIGIYWDKNGDGWLGYFISEKQLRLKTIEELFNSYELVKVNVEGLEKENFYIDRDNLEILYNIKDEVKKKVSFIAPLDNLIWDRKLIKEIFNFEYTWEVYVPVKKRKFGYYVLPVLYGNKFIARFEAKNFRSGDNLEIINWWWEDNIRVSNKLVLEISKAFNRFCRYLGADKLPQDQINKILQCSV